MKLKLTGITVRTTQLAWTVTLVTLSIFVGFIIPEQKRDLKEGLESKAHGVAAALQGEVAGAAISEDYSSVVEHAMQVVAGDPAVNFVLISKNDGYAVVVERTGWRVIPSIDNAWHPSERVAMSRIETTSLFGKRIFRYSVPFDYNGLQWGWIHVGLSLDSYDASVRGVYRRTGVLTIVCIALSLAASLFYARRFVQPILRLREVVERIARGDLSARADIHSNDEIEELSHAFNSMAATVLDRDRIVESVRFTAQALQGASDWTEVMDAVLAKIGTAARVSRVEVVGELTSSEEPSGRARFDWTAPDVVLSYPNSADRDPRECSLCPQTRRLSSGETLIHRKAELDGQPWSGSLPKPRSVIVAPIFVGAFWGALSLHDCASDREWGEAEQDAVRAVADMLGASITRQRAQTALVEAKSQLERRVAERTQELREQIVAKDRAHVELEEAQKRLIDLSRQSGMAEVATGVLHNVGNVLNSINVAANILTDRLQTSRIQQLHDLSQMLSEHPGSISDFLANDPRGQRVIPYFVKLSQYLLEERDGMTKELNDLVQHVSHVKEIVAMQQTYARTSGLLEKVSARDLLRDALNISRPGFDRHGIDLQEDLQADPILTTDRHKVLQILLNVLRNAKDAVKQVSGSSRKITVALCCPTPDRVQFQVSDNGIGIAEENLARIFSHGFTTKRNGHGFGLHSGALAANQLGGWLHAESGGVGLGATFRLELPIQPDELKN